MDIKNFKKGEVIFEEGTFGNTAYIIKSGSVEVVKRMSDGKNQQISKLEKNDIFGEMGLIDQLPRTATVCALEDCSISVMTSDNFDTLAKRNPQALMPILKVLASRLRNTLKIIEELDNQEQQNQALTIGNI